jgi:hypothetical protein
MAFIHVEELHLTVHVDRFHHAHHWPLQTFGPVSEQRFSGPVTERIAMLGVLTDSQQVDVIYPNPVDRKGKPAQVQEGSIAWKSTDESVATVVPDTTNPLKATIVAGNAGVCEVFPTADGDLGDGVSPIEGEHVGIQVTAGNATGFGSPTLGTPVEQP